MMIKMKRKELSILEGNSYLRNNINTYLEEKLSKAIYISYRDL